MKKFLTFLSLITLVVFAGACSDEKKDDPATLYHVTFDMTVGTQMTAIDVTGSRVFKVAHGAGGDGYTGRWSAAGSTSEFYFIFSAVGDLPYTFTVSNYELKEWFWYKDENEHTWKPDFTNGFVFTVTQLTPTVKGTFSGPMVYNGTIATIENGVYEGDFW